VSKVRVSVSSRISSRISVIRKTLCGSDEAIIRKAGFWTVLLKGSNSKETVRETCSNEGQLLKGDRQSDVGSLYKTTVSVPKIV
jgi:hypothetical protein